MRIRWTPMAAADLQHISNFMNDHRPAKRQQTMHFLYEAIRALKESPHSGCPSEDGTRELWFIGIPTLPYIPVYRVNQESIEVLRIYYSAQDRFKTTGS